MPFVALAPANRESRLTLADRRWTALLETRPDLAPAIALQRRLVGLVVDLAETIEQGRLPKLSLPPRYLAAKLGRGVPIFVGEPIPLPVPTLTPTLLSLCDELAQGGAGDAGLHVQVRAAIVETRLDAGTVLAASLARNQGAIRASGTRLGLAADLLWLVAELAVSPFAHALQRAYLGAAAAGTTLSSALSAWTFGYCPACGSWPALAEAAGDLRILRCSFCALAWDVPPSACVYCGNQGESLVTSAPDAGLPDCSLEVCSACSGYLKVVETDVLLPFPLIAIADMETMTLDMCALERGSSRPPLKDFLPRR